MEGAEMIMKMKSGPQLDWFLRQLKGPNEQLRPKGLQRQSYWRASKAAERVSKATEKASMAAGKASEAARSGSEAAGRASGASRRASGASWRA